MNTFTHFENKQFVGESFYIRPDFSIGKIRDIFYGGKIVISLPILDIMVILLNKEILKNMKITKEQSDELIKTFPIKEIGGSLHFIQNSTKPPEYEKIKKFVKEFLWLAVFAIAGKVLSKTTEEEFMINFEKQWQKTFDPE